MRPGGRFGGVPPPVNDDAPRCGGPIRCEAPSNGRFPTAVGSHPTPPTPECAELAAQIHRALGFLDPGDLVLARKISRLCGLSVTQLFVRALRYGALYMRRTEVETFVDFVLQDGEPQRRAAGRGRLDMG
jgi:hypothetical protein